MDGSPMPEDQVSPEFVDLFVRHQRRLYGYISTIVANPIEVDEIFQETSLILWKKRDSYMPDRDFVSWACGFARNVAMNYLSKRQRDRHWFSPRMLEHLAEARANRAEWLDSATRALVDCLRRLTEDQRLLIEVRYGSEKSLGDIARDMNCPANTIYQRLHRIRQKLYHCVRLGLRTEAPP